MCCIILMQATCFLVCLMQTLSLFHVFGTPRGGLFRALLALRWLRMLRLVLFLRVGDRASRDARCPAAAHFNSSDYSQEGPPITSDDRPAGAVCGEPAGAAWAAGSGVAGAADVAVPRGHPVSLDRPELQAPLRQLRLLNLDQSRQSCSCVACAPATHVHQPFKDLSEDDASFPQVQVLRHGTDERAGNGVAVHRPMRGPGEQLAR